MRVPDRTHLARGLVAFGAGWWLAATVSTPAIFAAATLDPTTGVPLSEAPLVPLVAAFVPGVAPVVLAWRVGIGTGGVRLPPECAGSTAGACHGIGWGIAAGSVVVGVVLAALAWLVLPVGVLVDGRGGDRPVLSRQGWVTAFVPYLAGVTGLAYLARRRGGGDRRAWLLAVGTAAAAYLLVAAATFAVVLLRAAAR